MGHGALNFYVRNLGLNSGEGSWYFKLLFLFYFSFTPNISSVHWGVFLNGKSFNCYSIDNLKKAIKFSVVEQLLVNDP